VTLSQTDLMRLEDAVHQYLNGQAPTEEEFAALMPVLARLSDLIQSTLTD
jgi:hypothetical protein